MLRDHHAHASFGDLYHLFHAISSIRKITCATWHWFPWRFGATVTVKAGCPEFPHDTLFLPGPRDRHVPLHYNRQDEPLLPELPGLRIVST